MFEERYISKTELIERFSSLDFEEKVYSEELMVCNIPSLEESSKGFIVDIEAINFAIFLQKQYNCIRESIQPRESHKIRIRDQRSADFVIKLFTTLGIGKIILEIIKFFDKRINSTMEIELIENEGENKFKIFRFKGLFKDYQQLLEEREGGEKDE